MADFVLVHGAWHGAWCWQRVLPLLWRAGHRAFAVSLTGVGEHAHLGTEGVDLQTHVDDVVAVIEAEELESAVLVGHSYGGMVVTGAASAVHTRIGHLVHLDAVVPRPGEAWSSGHTPEVRDARRKAIRDTGCIPPPDPAIFGLEGADRDWVARRQTPQPGGVYDAPLDFDASRIAALPRTFIDCVKPALPTVAMSRERVRKDPSWRVVVLETGHDPMVSAPQALVDTLLSLAPGGS